MDMTRFLFQYMRYGGGVKRSFPVSANAPHGALGEAGVYPHLTEAAFYETTAVQV